MKLPKNFLLSDELQTLIYQDVDGLTMQQGADKMGISKTVYAGIYATAKKKLVDFAPPATAPQSFPASHFEPAPTPPQPKAGPPLVEVKNNYGSK